MKMLLHVCCGPCSLEPLRIWQEAGHDITIYFTNSNIQPADEYKRRLNTLLEYAKRQGIPVIEAPYEPEAWNAGPGKYGLNPDTREKRCRFCYRVRLKETAQYAADHGFEALATTLAVSPYQYTEILEEEVTRIATRAGLVPIFEDHRPYYEAGQARACEIG
ncbi:MAG: epoxyqueuosine reductase QueH, partial [Eggerthellaceae bacterium]|nr:epoxyqueuosine reductase QueH [Eggerthellaceae bacterium]